MASLDREPDVLPALLAEEPEHSDIGVETLMMTPNWVKTISRSR